MKMGKAVTHLVDNEDGTHSVHCHSEKVACPECGSQGDCRKVKQPKALKVSSVSKPKTKKKKSKKVKVKSK